MPSSQLNLFVPARAPLPRVKRVEKEVRAILADIFQRQDIPPVFDKDKKLIPFPGIITVTGVHISGDLRECKVFLMPLASNVLHAGEHDNAEVILNYFETATPLIRKVFAHQSKMRIVPNFHFEIDSSFAVAERIDELLKINSSKETGEEEETQ
ncbi:MAG: 30S ribosome-binding factor RbfA [Holosporales bacterium]|jgi:ribosome-binding factor A|nr:30S ribosome-binding factor RbfA [Holosporales bacterium]